MRIFWPLAAALLLSACASGPTLIERRGDFDTLPEKSLYEALEKVEAQQEQRTRVMTAYDEAAAKSRALLQQQNALLLRWRSLPRQDAGFLPQAGELSTQWAGFAGERMRVQSEFEKQVATILDAGQWQRWQAFLAEDAERRIRLENYGGYYGGGATRTRRR